MFGRWGGGLKERGAKDDTKRGYYPGTGEGRGKRGSLQTLADASRRGCFVFCLRGWNTHTKAAHLLADTKHGDISPRFWFGALAPHGPCDVSPALLFRSRGR